jgi:UTP--glucose-1-phosphate uridylyltransferase
MTQTENTKTTNKQKVKKCLFPAAGYGTRFLPATKSMPKEMLPIVDKPIIQYGVEEAMLADMFNINIVTGRGKRAIEDHFDNNYELEHQLKGTSKEELLEGIQTVVESCNFSYTRQREMKGLGHAVLCGQSLIGNEPFAVVLADDVCTIDPEHGGILEQMSKIYDQTGKCVIATMEVPTEKIHKYGVISGNKISENLIEVTGMVEKPKAEDAPSNLAVIGRYILIPEIFEILKTTPKGAGGEIQLTDAILELAKQGKVLAYKFKGKRFDCGSVEGFVEATNAFFEAWQKK